MIPHVLSIAGSDPSAGAGAQADLKAFSALGCYGLTVLTALTAQNTQGVTAIHALPPDFVRAQLEAVFSDIRIDAVKIGMAGNAESIETIAAVLKKYAPPVIILDPVMVAQSGDVLIDEEAVAALKKYMIPLATLITPNIPEAHKLLNETESTMEEVAGRLYQKYKIPVLLKGGHGNGGDSTDILMIDQICKKFSAPRIQTRNNHGTGCTLASAVAAFMARGEKLETAIAAAKKYLTGALAASEKLQVGTGAGPVHHFYALWGNDDE